MDKIGFGTLNSIVLGVYLIAMLAIGVYFTKKAGESTDEFFKAGGNIPSWAVGFSIYATTLSAITFMAGSSKIIMTREQIVAMSNGNILMESAYIGLNDGAASNGESASGESPSEESTSE